MHRACCIWWPCEQGPTQLLFYPLQNIVSLFLKKKDYTWNTEFVNITSIYYNNNNSNKRFSIDKEHGTKQRMRKKRKRKLKSFYIHICIIILAKRKYLKQSLLLQSISLSSQCRKLQETEMTLLTSLYM